ncbi:uncharacterized protein PpBr36_06301 [Pyricularia pennisetigena]|uniref:uncharacterized protein n=1 Tax=Pyricularia pennisetigena TaxID=1578925 RepID=UPI00114EF731|nr:uncharacterized protein PpBr36_06301 [Pyricularia pennisetigena]TLS23539.1 hypothetical protein PpBr36_06301 [Pyricularia pennisetigena]
MASMSVVLMGLGLGHLEREDLRGGKCCKRYVGTQGLSHSHGNGCLARAWWAGDEDGASGNLALLDHLEHDGGGLARFGLAYKALR